MAIGSDPYKNLHNFKAETPPLVNFDTYDEVENMRSIDSIR